MTTSWPTPVQRVQLLAESGVTNVPSQYIRPKEERPQFGAGDEALATQAKNAQAGVEEADQRQERLSIPVLDMGDLEIEEKKGAFVEELKRACEEWGFFYVKNHGVEEEVMEGVRRAAGEFFKLPIGEKQAYANDPVTYQGYGSRIGVSKGAVLDWGDYFYVTLLPAAAVDISKWPTNPALWREMVEEYGKQVMKLFKKLTGALSMSLGLEGEGTLEKALGEVDVGLRINYYPACPQPELTFGLSPHSDPGALTLLLSDPHVDGLQVKAPTSTSTSTSWVTVPPLPASLVVNIADQLEILTNGKFKSVEHRVVVNNNYERLSLACFISPGSDTLLAPLPELVPKDELPAYKAMTSKTYRALLRKGGPKGKAHVNSMASPTSLTSSPTLKY